MRGRNAFVIDCNSAVYLYAGRYASCEHLELWRRKVIVWNGYKVCYGLPTRGSQGYAEGLLSGSETPPACRPVRRAGLGSYALVGELIVLTGLPVVCVVVLFSLLLYSPYRGCMFLV